jgi:hypothetical protein
MPETDPETDAVVRRTGSSPDRRTTGWKPIGLSPLGEEA